MLNKKTNLIIFLGIITAILVVGFLYFSSSKKTEKNNEIEIPKNLQLGDETINLDWTDDNQGEDLIIQSDKKSYFGIDKSEVYFSITNTNKKEQRIDLRFLFGNEKASLVSIEKINGEKTEKLGEVDAIFEDKEGFISSDYFGDSINSGETNYYKAQITYPANSEGEFHIEAKGNNGAYGLLDPWYNSTGLVGYWSMDGDDVDWSATTAEVIDRSGQGNHGDAYNMSSANAYIGKSGQALDFGGSGSGDYIVPPSSDLNTYINDTTVVAWVRFDNHASANFTPIYNNNTSSNSNLNIYMDVENNSLRCLSGNNAGDIITTPDITDGEWYLVVCTRSVADNQLKLYVNGALKATDSSLTARTYNAASPVAIGTSAYMQGSYLFDGKIDELAVFNRALSADEISALYKLGNRKIENKAMNNTGLVGYWTMDDVDLEWGQTSSEVRDKSAFGNHGDALNITSSNAVAGKFAQALLFEAGDDHVKIPNSSSLEPSNFTITGWYYKNSGSSDRQAIVGKQKDTDNDNSWVIYAESDAGGPNLNFYGTFGEVATHVYSGVATPLDRWAHVAVTYDHANVKLYMDGEYITQTAATTDPSYTVSNPVIIGAEETTGDAIALDFKGKIDDVRIYDRALSSDEIGNVYDTGAKKIKINTSNVNRLTSGLVGHWTFDGADMDWSATTAEAIDRSGQGNHGNATNMDLTNAIIGKVGQSLGFNGTNEYINLGDSKFQYANNYAISAWFMPTGKVSDVQSIFSTWGARSILRVETSGQVSFYTFNSEVWYGATSPTALNNYEWYHAVAVKEANNNLRLYVNGVLIDSDPMAVPSLYVSGPTNIGGNVYTGAPYYFQGPIDEVRVYNRALSTDEITELYQMGTKKLKIKQ